MSESFNLFHIILPFAKSTDASIFFISQATYSVALHHKQGCKQEGNERKGEVKHNLGWIWGY